MKAFWWFKENSIAGMARPGFNAIHWFDLPFDEAALLGWIGQFSSGSESLDSFRRHLHEYAPKIYKFYGLNETSGYEALKIFDDISGINEISERLSSRSQILESFRIENDQIYFDMNTARLQMEIEFLRKKNIETVVCLTERHHSRDVLDTHFDTHHFSIKDLSAPEMDQVLKLADLISISKKNNKKLAIHCLAGIGRTSTMLLAAHIVLGEDVAQLKQLIAKQNPTYKLTGSQGDFIHKVVAQYGASADD